MSQELPSRPDGVEQKQTIRDVSIINSQYVHIRQDITEQVYILADTVKTEPFTGTSPYKGLQPFDFQDKDLFFGRTQFLNTLVDELEQTNLILLLGASGSGKSSVVQAGLLSPLTQAVFPFCLSSFHTRSRSV